MPSASGNPDIEQHQVGPPRARNERAAVAFSATCTVCPSSGEDFREQLPDSDFVVDDQYLGHSVRRRAGGKFAPPRRAPLLCRPGSRW